MIQLTWAKIPGVRLLMAAICCMPHWQVFYSALNKASPSLAMGGQRKDMAPACSVSLASREHILCSPQLLIFLHYGGIKDGQAQAMRTGRMNLIFLRKTVNKNVLSMDMKRRFVVLAVPGTHMNEAGYTEQS